MASFATVSSQVRHEKYDVFISFRGSDIRARFLSHLTKQLRQHGIDVYVDERLERGDEISYALLEAIERSVIALVIFSKDYASSRWCLEELETIMECKRVNNQIVIPVFYNVDPSHVRHQERTYADAFAQHKQKLKYNLKKLQVWRTVLKETADLSGFHSLNFNNESDLIDEIVKDVSKKLEAKHTIEPKRLIGFEEDLASIESFMKVNSQEVGVLGIWGKGGIGKTTLARAAFDKFFSQFDRSYFVSNVKEESKKLGLTCLLEKILSVLLNDENLTIKGRPNTQRRLLRTRVLLVLDDVDTSSQLKYLFEENLSLGPSSKVIITTRDRHVLVSGGVQVIHEVKELNMEESLQLFCLHAFKQTYPRMGYERLSAQTIHYARGLPLALKVLGSYLNSRNTITWESVLKKLRKYPNVEIQNVLRVSYDGLDIPEKRVFLDIAFFFRGEKTEDIIRVLDACDDFYADCGIEILLDKALITISRDNRVEIHDLLQEMAEDIVREESREHPEKRSRLNDAKEIQEVLKSNKGTDSIEGIKWDSENDLYLSIGTFKKMSNLRFLMIKHPLKGNPIVHLPNGLDSLSNELRYFSWSDYPLKSLPLGFSPKKLVEIHMPFSKVARLWDGVQDFMNLKVLDLSFSMWLKELPDFSMAQNLEIVDLSWCRKLCIHPSILSLPKLVSLNVRTCTSLKEISLSSKEMRKLVLFGSGVRTLNWQIGRFNKLEALYLGPSLGNFQINELSCLTSLKIFTLCDFTEGIDKSKLHILFNAWRSLEELYLMYSEVGEIPDNISDISLLKILSLRGCSMESLPNSIKHLSELKKIDLSECQCLRSLPELPPSITRLFVQACTSLEIIDFRWTSFEHNKEESSRGLDRCGMTDFMHFTLMQAICKNKSGDVRVSYPGNTIPKGFKYSQIGESSITIELAPASASSDHLMGFASCVILSPSEETNCLLTVSVCRKFHFEDEEINYRGENEFHAISNFSTCNVFVWYDPMELILNGTQRMRFDKGTTHQKFACEFFLGDLFHSRVVKYDHLIKACGLWPIFASELHDTVRQMELRLQKSSVRSNTTHVRQRTYNLRAKRSRIE